VSFVNIVICYQFQSKSKGKLEFICTFEIALEGKEAIWEG
jgi:hypothetical protein